MASQPHEVVEYLEDTKAQDPSVNGGSVTFGWNDGNVLDIFDDLAGMGWRVSSIYSPHENTIVWLDSAERRPRQGE